MAKHLLIKPEVCIGCRSCELVCVYRRTGEFRPSGSAIRLFEFPGTRTTVPLMCMQCEDAVCLEACAFGALTRDPVTCAVLHHPEKCVLCRMCLKACPLGGVTFDPVQGNIVKCNLCGGDPACVKVCPVAAIDYADIPDGAPSCGN
jgi:Fe-S-cluster-containing hydrogenase component 2